MGELTCQRDGVATQLTCAGCAAPICPSCLVRTPVGLKCRDCTGAATRASRRSVPVLLLAVVALVVLPVLVWLALGVKGSGSGGGASDAARNLDIVNAGAQSHLGEELQGGPFRFKVTQAECVGREVGAPPETRVAQGRFCLVYLTLRNVGDRPEVYSASLQLVSDSSAKRYFPGVMEPGPPLPPLVTGSGAKEIVNVRLNPGAETQGVLIFDMPVAAKPAEFEFHHRPRAIGVKVRLDTLTP